jgi:two-component system cell cycle response regulator DivK
MKVSERARRRILVVEDDPLNMRMFCAMIGAQGHQALQATDGLRGLDVARWEHPDLIIMDVQLPGISGLEVTQALKDDPRTSSIPIIITTAYLLNDEEIRASRCDGYLAKPITVSEFVDTIESLVVTSARMFQLADQAVAGE